MLKKNSQTEPTHTIHEPTCTIHKPTCTIHKPASCAHTWTKPKNAPQPGSANDHGPKKIQISHFKTNQRLEITLHDLVTINGSEC